MQINFSGDKEYSRYARILLAGAPGVGKTSFALTASNPFVISASPDLTTLARHGGTPYVDVRSEDQFFAVTEFLRRPEEEIVQAIGRPVSTVVIDRLDEFQRRMLVGRVEAERRSEIKGDDWNWIAQRLNVIFESITKLPYHMVFIVNTKEVWSDDEVFVRPALQGSFADSVHGYVQASLLMRADDPIIDTDAATIHSGQATLSIEVERRTNRYLVSRSLASSEWVHDATNSLPHLIDVNDGLEGIIGRIEAVRQGLQESRSVEVETLVEPPPSEGMIRMTSSPKEESVTATLPGMSSDDRIRHILERAEKAKREREASNE